MFAISLFKYIFIQRLETMDDIQNVRSAFLRASILSYGLLESYLTAPSFVSFQTILQTAQSDPSKM